MNNEILPEETIIPCKMCAQQRQQVEEAGGTFISCKPVPDDPGKCKFIWIP